MITRHNRPSKRGCVSLWSKGVLYIWGYWDKKIILRKHDFKVKKVKIHITLQIKIKTSTGQRKYLNWRTVCDIIDTVIVNKF